MIVIGFPNRVNDQTNVAGGDWETALPSTNVTTRNDADVARSVDALEASTVLTLDHGAAVSARVLVIRWHNLSADATVTWSRGTTSGDDDVDTSGAVDAWVIAPYTFDGHAHQVIVVLNSQSSARYDTIQISDETNPDGYVEIGQILIAPVISNEHRPACAGHAGR